jgi:hypothetical protein
VLVVGSVVITVLTTLSALPVALRALRQRGRRGRVSRLATAATAAGMPAPAVQGIRLATLGGGPRPVPMRSALLAVTIAIVSVVATVSFASSMTALIDTPARYGQGWDRMVDAQFGPAPSGRIVELAATSDAVSGLAAGNYGTVTIDGLQIPAFDLRVISGDVSIGILDGRAAVAPGEIVLGSETMSRLGRSVGDSIEADVGDGPRPMQITGRGVFPHMGQGSFSTTGLGVGAQLPADTLVSFDDFGPMPDRYMLDGRTYNFVALDAEGAPSDLDPLLEDIEATVNADGAFAFLRLDQPPTKIQDLDRVRVVPAILAGVLSVVAVAALTHVLITLVRERRRELAVLRTIGFSSGQLRATVAWQASLITASALVVGAPLGLVLGRLVWQRFAHGLDVEVAHALPWLWLLVALVATFALANAVAALPGQRAARTRPAAVLRDE